MEWFLLVECLELVTQAPDREFYRSIMNILTKLSMKYCL
jgi:hypothetical protein